MSSLALFHNLARLVAAMAAASPAPELRRALRGVTRAARHSGAVADVDPAGLLRVNGVAYPATGALAGLRAIALGHGVGRIVVRAQAPARELAQLAGVLARADAGVGDPVGELAGLGLWHVQLDRARGVEPVVGALPADADPVVVRLRDARDAAEVGAAVAALRAWLADADLGAPRTAAVLARVLDHALGTAPEDDHGLVAALAEVLATTDLRPLVDAALAGTAAPPEGAGTDALLVLQCVTPTTVPLVIERLAEAQTLETRRRCCDLLLALGSGIDLLVAALDDPRWYLARNAALLLGELQAEDAVRPLARMLASADLRVRVAAAGALAQIGNVPALHALSGALDDRAVEVRQIAARGVADAARRGAFVVAATCIAALEREDDADVSLELIAALGRIGSGDAMRYLRQTATGRNRFVGQPELRSAAIGAVVDARTPAAKDAQRALAADPDPAVRRITAEYWHRAHRPAA